MRKRIGLIFGGRSSEHEVSITSARSVLKAIDAARYDVELICITPDGRWVTGAQAHNLLEGKPAPPTDNVILPHYPGENRLVALDIDGGRECARRLVKLDVVFPLLHGTFGEDGTIQGLFELAGIPYVGAGVAASAAGMDKVIMKDIFRANELPVTKYIHFLRKEWISDPGSVSERVFGDLGFPVFVKPANTGSSVGITKVYNKNELSAALDCASEFDRKIIVERGVDARELECSVLGNDDAAASVVGEIIPAREFYDYEAKYIDEGSKLIIPAEITEDQSIQVRDFAVKAFKALDCAGMARADFLLERTTGEIIINEINTIPGFTPISMYPKLWEASGITYGELIDRLIELAFERHADMQNRCTTYKVKKT
ncbi:D-alanine--D-alanine ligase family protein [candidate division KSB1 bacterium]